MPDFRLQVYTQEKMVFDGQVSSLVAPGEDGYFGVLANHAPLIATLGEGTLTLRGGSETHTHKISGGFLEVHANMATILADSLI